MKRSTSIAAALTTLGILSVVVAVGQPLAQEASELEAQVEKLESAPKREAKMGKAEELAVIETSMGEVAVRLFPDVAPKAVENFVRLSKKGYYENVIFHRIIPKFMIQGGDPTGTGYGGKSIWGVSFEDEVTPELRFERAGLLAMANTGRPKTNSSQFFITLGATPWLNDKHTIFGEVVQGMDVVEAMGAVETGPNDRPAEDVVIKSVRMEERIIE